MDILDRLLGHDVGATRDLLAVCRDLPDEALDRRFEFGQETLRRTFLHLIGNMEVWTRLMAGRAARPEAGEDADSIDGLARRLDAVAAEFASLAQRVQAEGRLDECFVDSLDQPPRRKTYGGGIVHLATHSMHHRAQILVMLELLGVRHDVEGDALGWERRLRGGWGELRQS